MFCLTGFKSLTQWLARSRATSIVAVVDRKGAVLLIAPGGELGLALDAGLTSMLDHGLRGATIAVNSGRRLSKADQRLREVALALATQPSLWYALRAAGLSDSRIGTDDPAFAAEMHSRLGRPVETRTDLLSSVRAIKTAVEIQLLENSVRIAEAAMSASMEVVADGVQLDACLKQFPEEMDSAVRAGRKLDDREVSVLAVG